MAERPLVGFDLDGVIMQNPFEKGVEPRMLAHLRLSPELRGLHPEEADRRARTALREEWDRLAAAGEWVAAYDWDGVYNAVSRRFGGEPSPDVAAMVEELSGIEGMVRLLPGARTGLDRLDEAGYRVVAITNGYHAYQWPVLRALGVADAFERIISPEAVGYAKPDPRLFASVPGLQAHVGDSLVWDVLGANMAEIVSVWLDEYLPPELRTLPLGDRTTAAPFPAYLEGRLEKIPYRRYHPEATLANCTPDAVTVDVDEAAEVLLQRFG